MAYKVADSLWLETEVERVKSIILLPMYWGFEWDITLIRTELANNQKLEYTVQQMSQIGQELIDQGVIVEV